MNTRSNLLPARMGHSRHAAPAGILSSMTKLIIYKVTTHNGRRTRTKLVRAQSLMEVLDRIGTRNNTRLEIVRIIESK